MFFTLLVIKMLDAPSDELVQQDKVQTNAILQGLPIVSYLFYFTEHLSKVWRTDNVLVVLLCAWTALPLTVLVIWRGVHVTIT